MGVQLNIKSAEARALAEEVAAATGTSITEAVTEALRQRRDELNAEQEAKQARARALVERIMAMTEGNRERWPKHLLDIDHGDLLYDERGLPK